MTLIYGIVLTTLYSYSHVYTMVSHQLYHIPYPYPIHIPLMFHENH